MVCECCCIVRHVVREGVGPTLGLDEAAILLLLFHVPQSKVRRIAIVAVDVAVSFVAVVNVHVVLAARAAVAAQRRRRRRLDFAGVRHEGAFIGVVDVASRILHGLATLLPLLLTVSLPARRVLGGPGQGLGQMPLLLTVVDFRSEEGKGIFVAFLSNIVVRLSRRLGRAASPLG